MENTNDTCQLYLVKMLLELLIGVVDTKLFKAICFKALKTINIKYTNQ